VAAAARRRTFAATSSGAPPERATSAPVSTAKPTAIAKVILSTTMIGISTDAAATCAAPHVPEILLLRWTDTMAS